MANKVDVVVKTGPDIPSVLTDLARLRSEVFREWPYLYEADATYERAYLDTYCTAKSAVIVCAYHGSVLVGAATGCLILEHSDDFSAALSFTDFDVSRVFYCAESVLLEPFRGQGVGHRFFDARETHAKNLGCTTSTFCAVVRPDIHALKPAEYRPLAPFWTNRGYRPVDGAIAYFDWQDVDQDCETRHALQFWARNLES